MVGDSGSTRATTMVATVRVRDVEPGSELDRLLMEADEQPVLLVRDGRRYRLSREPPPRIPPADDPWAAYDPERLMAGIERGAGRISETEAEEMIANIYRWREEGSQEPTRP